jgi:hypothetical protein
VPVSPARPGPGRLARSPELLAELAGRLTPRDRWLLRMLHEHRVLTTPQVTQLAFGTSRAATARLLALWQLRAVDRFRPLTRTGSAPLHFVLDDAGAAVLAAEDGLTPARLGHRRDRALGIALSLQLSHATGTNGVFCALAAAGRAGAGTLGCWWSERRCAALWGDLARPDGYGQWTEHGPAGPVTTDFFLEYDTGTESLARVAAKLGGYAGLAARTGIPTPVLFWLTSPAREAALRDLLASPGQGLAGRAFTVATATPQSAGASPAGAAWLPAGQDGPRLRLARLAPAARPVPSAEAPAASAAAPPAGLPWHPPSPVPPPL